MVLIFKIQVKISRLNLLSFIFYFPINKKTYIKIKYNKNHSCIARAITFFIMLC